MQSANANEARQIAQLENLIAEGVDALVIVPFNSKVLSNVIAKARKSGIKVIAYDRLILGAPLDAYVSFDNVKVGEMQAQGVIDVVPKGNYYLLGGASTDNNARLFREGQMNVLKPLADKGDIKIVGEQWTPEWDPSKAQAIIENALNANSNNIQAIVASNDGTAGGAIQALTSQKLAGKVAVSGQDADGGRAPRGGGHADHDHLQTAQEHRQYRRAGGRGTGAGQAARVQRQARQRQGPGGQHPAQAHAADARQPGHLGQGRVLYGGTDRGQVAATGDG